jgi:hypothetical protein
MAEGNRKIARKNEISEHKKARLLKVEHEPPLFRIFLRNLVTESRYLAGKALDIVSDLLYSNFTSVPALPHLSGKSSGTRIRAPGAGTPPRRP